VLSEHVLAEVLEIQKTARRRLGDLLAERNLVPPRQLAQIISYQLSCPWLSLNNVEIPRALIELVPREIAIAHTLVPVHLRQAEGRHLYVAIHDPTDEVALTECARAVKMPVKPMVAITYEIRQALARYYGAPLPSLTTAPVRLQVVRSPEPPGLGEPALAAIAPTSAPELSRVPKPQALPQRAALHSVPPAVKPSTLPPRPASTMPPRSSPMLPPRAASTMPPRSSPMLPPRAASTMPPPAGPTSPPRVAPTPPPAGPTSPPRAASTMPPPAGPTSPPRVASTMPPPAGPTSPPRIAPTPPPPTRHSSPPTVLVVNAPLRFRDQCAAAASALGANVIDGSLVNVVDVAKRCLPAAIVVTDDIYAFDRAGLNRLAIDIDAVLVIWSDDVEAHQLEPLLEGAIQRASRVRSLAAS